MAREYDIGLADQEEQHRTYNARLQAQEENVTQKKKKSDYKAAQGQRRT
jgi:hypothetical protein